MTSENGDIKCLRMLLQGKTVQEIDSVVRTSAHLVNMHHLAPLEIAEKVVGESK